MRHVAVALGVACAVTLLAVAAAAAPRPGSTRTSTCYSLGIGHAIVRVRTRNMTCSPAVRVVRAFMMNHTLRCVNAATAPPPSRGCVVRFHCFATYCAALDGREASWHVIRHV